jgi:hypothetical protein
MRRRRRRDLVDFLHEHSRLDRQPSSPPDTGSAGRRLAWTIVGMVAFFTAMHFLGWA